ncbi:MAG: flavodoxin family protein [Deltaproteobacteria bacterium]|nr:flavodoxin family protein [Deltaproteobacteria bacterium]MBW2382426.1 flavodoxin family protein [Deltaproteobacteria bacterium]
MTKVSVVYHSKDGHTKIMAEGVLEGASSIPGVEASLHAIVPDDFEAGVWTNAQMLAELDEADAIIFGCPTWMGCISSPLKAFFDATLDRWYPRVWKDKVGAGFTVSATPSGDKLNTLSDLLYFGLQHGMVWVGMERTPMNDEGINRLSVFLGAVGQGVFGSTEITLHDGDRKSGAELGARVARIASELGAGRSASAHS